MVDPIPVQRPVHWDRLRSDEAERIIRERAQDSENVITSSHAFERIEERSIIQNDVYDIPRTGQVNEAPRRDDAGNWVVIMEKLMPGGRAAGIVTIVYRAEGKLFVKLGIQCDPLQFPRLRNRRLGRRGPALVNEHPDETDARLDPNNGKAHAGRESRWHCDHCISSGRKAICETGYPLRSRIPYIWFPRLR